MYQIKPGSDPYSQTIANALSLEFPTQCVASSAQLVDLISAEILGTKQQRYGPKPSVEVQASIREVIRRCVEGERPIPFLVPWGSEKPVHSIGPDLAELWALKMLRCLNYRVSQHYKPGLIFRLRLDDASAPHLFFDDMDAARADTQVYCPLLEGIVEVLEMPFVQVIRESQLASEEAFNKEADRIVPAMEAYLHSVMNLDGDLDFKRLYGLGWTGRISPETAQFYLSQYDKLYPSDDESKKMHRLARYLSGSLARKNLHMDASDPAWLGRYLELAFFTSPPGVLSRFGTRVYYRTLPCSLTANHMAPWRAKGYMLITGEEDVVPKLASFNAPLGYNPNTVTLVNGDKSVVVQADYVVTEHEE